MEHDQWHKTKTESQSLFRIPHSALHYDRPALQAWQAEKCRALFKQIIPQNRFYIQKFAQARLDPDQLQFPEGISRISFTTKAELVQDQLQNAPYGSNLTYPQERYCRLHQTSGTSGKPLRWLDTTESWQWMLSCWQAFFDLAGVVSTDRLFFPFSFGPFLGFWTAFEAATQRGYFCLSGGGMSSGARLRFLLDNEVSVVLCTPTYALNLAETAGAESLDLTGSPVRLLIVAGEPGGSISATRSRIESSWGARLFDHYGLTEVGPLGIECRENPGGLHLLETHYFVEVIDVESGLAALPGQTGELVVTNLGRTGSPLVRYRTGDLVCVDPDNCSCGRILLRLRGGILGRTDDMIHVRGNNIYPAALEGIIRRFPQVAEYRVLVDRTGSLSDLTVDLELVSSAPQGLIERVSRAIKDELLFRANINRVAPGTLPRFEMKARRIIVWEKSEK